jgi:hypothetical protein
MRSKRKIFFKISKILFENQGPRSPTLTKVPKLSVQVLDGHSLRGH